VNGALSRLFHQSFSVGKRVRRETEIGRNALSVSHAGVELARKALGDLRESRVMVVGAGEAGKLVAHALCKKGVGRIVVVNRTPQRAQELASQLGGEAASFDQMQALLSCVDIVVSATDAQGVVLPLALMKQVMAARGPVPLVLVDIAVPRDVDPQVANLDNVSLFDLDDLTCVSQAGRMEREKEVARVEEIIGQETAKFMEWWTSLEVVPVIAALREQAEALRRRELAKTLKTMPHLPKQEVERIEALSEALVSKLLHHPIAAIRGMKSQAHVHLTRELFCLDDKGPEAGGGHHEAGDAASQHRRE
jgi:glutamyl-tRNA reductase